MKKKMIIAISVFLMFSSVSCEKKNSPEISGDIPEVSEEPTTIKLATFYNMSKTEKNLISKMKEKSGTNVDITYYNYTETSEPFELLNLDMISGDCPDVLCVPPQDMYNFIKAGYMSDMYPLLEKSPTLNKESFLPNVLSGLDVDEKLPAICDGFILSTAVAKTKIVGETAENWTPQQALELLNTIPEDTAFLAYSSKAVDVPYYLTERLAIDAIDYKNNTCNFDGEYKEVLNFIENSPEFLDFTHTDFAEYSLIDDTALIGEITIWGIDNSISCNTFQNFNGEDITFVGYPSETGKGYLTEGSTMFGIPEICTQKEEAFELISLMISDVSVNSYLNMGIPALEKRVQDDLKTSKYTQTSINCPVNINGEEVQMPEEKIQKVMDYIRNITFEPYNQNTEINNIVRQEFSRFLNKEISAQECTDILNNRLSLYLSETN